MSILVIIIIAIVGYFVIKALFEPRLIPIPKRIKMLEEIIDNLQAYLSSEYKKELEEYKAQRLKDKFWDEDSLKWKTKQYRDFNELININSRLCERYRNDQDKLLAQLADWAMLLEHYRDIQYDHNLNMAYIESNLDTVFDESKMAERGGKIAEICERIKHRAAVEKIPHKVLEISQ